MKKLASVLLAIAFVFTLSSCAGYEFVKKNPEQVEDVETAKVIEAKAKDAKKEKKDKTLHNMMEEIMSDGETIDRDVHGRVWIVPDGKGGYKEIIYSWERVVVEDNDSDDIHAIIFEFGQLRKVEPVDSLEDAKERFKPYGGWKD